VKGAGSNSAEIVAVAVAARLGDRQKSLFTVILATGWSAIEERRYERAVPRILPSRRSEFPSQLTGEIGCGVPVGAV